MTTKPYMSETKVRTPRKEKVIDSDKSKHLRRKHEQVIETLAQGDCEYTSEEEEGETMIPDEEFVLPDVIGDRLNLSKKNLKEFPRGLLDKMFNVQYLYLEGNNLLSLPEDFFRRLYFLKWLDLRNNNLTTLPTLGLKNHRNLEVILLQGNRIRNLPVELASIPSLKGLQTTGNPITNVPYEVIAQGFQGVMKYLEKIFAQEEILLPVSEKILVKPSTSKDNSANEPANEGSDQTDTEIRMWDLEKLSQWRQFMKKKSEKRNPIPLDASSQLKKKVNDKPVMEQPKISVSLRSNPKLPARPQPFRCGVYNRNRHRNMVSAMRYLKMRKTRLGYKRKPITVAMIQEKARKEVHRAQVRETLEKQARKIQRLRDKEVLKNWRDHAKITRYQMKLLDNYQRYPSKDFANKTPFDVDPEFLNMLNRVDLYRSLKDYDNRSKRNKKPRTRLTALDLERQMNEIIKKLQELDTSNPDEPPSPKTKQIHMCDKMFKIMDIQKTLKSLQTLNSSMNGIMPLIKSKPKN